MAKKVCLNMELSRKDHKTLKWLCKELDLDLSQTVRRSVDVLAYLLCQTNDGSKLIIREETGDREIVII